MSGVEALRRYQWVVFQSDDQDERPMLALSVTTPHTLLVIATFGFLNIAHDRLNTLFGRGGKEIISLGGLMYGWEISRTERRQLKEAIRLEAIGKALAG